MKTYWDLEEKERAALTREEVERFLDAELMTKGVLKVAPLEFEQEPVVAEPETRTFYQVGPVAFASADAADAFMKLSPLSVTTKYLGSGYSSRNSLEVGAALDCDVIEKRLVSERELELRKSALEQRAAVRDVNDRRRAEHKTATVAQDKVLAGVWEDWQACRRVDEAHRRVVTTFNDYVETAGDRFTAARFLCKVFTREAIDEASKWCGVAIPDTSIIDGEFAEAEPAPEQEAPVELTF